MASQRPLLSTFSYWHDIPILHTTCSAIQAGYIYKDAGKDDHTISSTSTSSSPSLVSSLPGPYIVTACMNGELIHWEKIEGEHMPYYRPRALLLHLAHSPISAITYCRYAEEGIEKNGIFVSASSEGFMSCWSGGGGRCIKSTLVLPFEAHQLLSCYSYHAKGYHREGKGAIIPKDVIHCLSTSPPPIHSSISHRRSYVIASSPHTHLVYIIAIPKLTVVRILQHNACVVECQLAPYHAQSLSSVPASPSLSSSSPSPSPVDQHCLITLTEQGEINVWKIYEYLGNTKAVSTYPLMRQTSNVPKPPLSSPLSSPMTGRPSILYTQTSNKGNCENNNIACSPNAQVNDQPDHRCKLPIGFSADSLKPPLSKSPSLPFSHVSQNGQQQEFKIKAWGISADKKLVAYITMHHVMILSWPSLTLLSSLHSIDELFLHTYTHKQQNNNGQTRYYPQIPQGFYPDRLIGCCVSSSFPLFLYPLPFLCSWPYWLPTDSICSPRLVLLSELGLLCVWEIKEKVEQEKFKDQQDVVTLELYSILHCNHISNFSSYFSSQSLPMISEQPVYSKGEEEGEGSTRDRNNCSSIIPTTPSLPHPLPPPIHLVVDINRILCTNSNGQIYQFYLPNTREREEQGEHATNHYHVYDSAFSLWHIVPFQVIGYDSAFSPLSSAHTLKQQPTGQEGLPSSPAPIHPNNRSISSPSPSLPPLPSDHFDPPSDTKSSLLEHHSTSRRPSFNPTEAVLLVDMDEDSLPHSTVHDDFLPLPAPLLSPTSSKSKTYSSIEEYRSLPNTPDEEQFNTAAIWADSHSPTFSPCTSSCLCVDSFRKQVVLAKGFKHGGIQLINIAGPVKGQIGAFNKYGRMDLHAHTGEVTCLLSVDKSVGASSHRSILLVSGGMDGQVMVWEMNSGKLLQVFQVLFPVHSIHTPSPFPTLSCLLSSHKDGSLQNSSTDITNSTPMSPSGNKEGIAIDNTLTGQSAAAYSSLPDADVSYHLPSSDVLFVCTYNGNISVIQIQAQEITGYQTAIQVFRGHDSPIQYILYNSWCVDNDYLLSFTTSGRLYLWIYSAAQLEYVMDSPSHIARFLQAHDLIPSHSQLYLLSYQLKQMSTFNAGQFQVLTAQWIQQMVENQKLFRKIQNADKPIGYAHSHIFDPINQQYILGTYSLNAWLFHQSNYVTAILSNHHHPQHSFFVNLLKHSNSAAQLNLLSKNLLNDSHTPAIPPTNCFTFIQNNNMNNQTHGIIFKPSLLHRINVPQCFKLLDLGVGGRSHLHVSVYCMDVHLLLNEMLQQYAKYHTAQRGSISNAKQEGQTIWHSTVANVFDWNEALQPLMKQLHILPPHLSPSPSLLSAHSQCITILFPSHSYPRCHARWKIDPEMTAFQSLVTNTVISSLSSCSDTQHKSGFTKLSSYYSKQLPQYLPHYVECDLNLLAIYCLNIHENIHNTARQLLQGVLDRSSPSCRSLWCRVYGSFYTPYTLDGGKTGGNQTTNKDSKDSEKSSDSKRRAAPPQLTVPTSSSPTLPSFVSDKEFISAMIMTMLGILEATLHRKAEREIQQAMSRGVTVDDSIPIGRSRSSRTDVKKGSIVEPSVFETKAPFIANTWMRMIAWNGACTPGELVKMALACELLAKGLLLFIRFINHDIITLIRRLQCLTTVKHSNVSSSSRRLLMEVARFCPDSFMYVTDKEILRAKQSNQLEKQYAMFNLLTLVRRNPTALYSVLLDTIHVLVKSMDPKDVALKDLQLRSNCWETIQLLVSAFPMTALGIQGESQNLAVANTTKFKENLLKYDIAFSTFANNTSLQQSPNYNNNSNPSLPDQKVYPVGSIILYHVKTAHKWKVLEGGHREDVTAIAFHPNGHLLASYCAPEALINIWKLGDGLLSNLLHSHGKVIKQISLPPIDIQAIIAHDIIHHSNRIQYPFRRTSTVDIHDMPTTPRLPTDSPTMGKRSSYSANTSAQVYLDEDEIDENTLILAKLLGVKLKFVSDTVLHLIREDGQAQEFIIQEK